jgi:hypothetical protein
MKDIFSSLDFISPQPSFKIKKGNRLKNALSGIFSLIAFLLILSITIYSIHQMFTRSTSTVILNTIPDSHQKQNLSELPFMIGLINNLGQIIQDDESVYVIKSEVWQIYNNNTNPMMQQMVKRASIILEKCDINKHFGEYKKYFQKTPYINYHYCTDPNKNNMTIFRPFSTNSNFIIHAIGTCNNKTSNGKICKDQKTIETILSNIFISHVYLEFSIDHKNISYPGSLSLRSDLLPASSSLFTRYWYSYKNIEYLSDLGYIFEDNYVKKYFQVSRPSQTVSLITQNTILTGTFINIFLSMDHEYHRYQRSFMKLQNLVASVGGIIKGVWILFQTLLYFFNLDNYYHELIQSLFIISKESNYNSDVKNKIIDPR